MSRRPPIAKIVSFPPSPQITSRPGVPTSRSRPAVPQIVQPAGRGPSGCQSGSLSCVKDDVIRRRPEPSVRIVHTSRSSLALRSLAKMIRLPSGDHCGSASSAGWFVSRVWFDPSAFIE